MAIAGGDGSNLSAVPWSKVPPQLPKVGVIQVSADRSAD